MTTEPEPVAGPSTFAPVPEHVQGPFQERIIPNHNVGPIFEVDNIDEKSDPGFEDGDYRSITASLNRAIQEYRQINGRSAPNDDIHHMMCLAYDNQLFLAPLKNPQRVLDVGCGTGIWCLDFAEQFPAAQVIGIDISPIQPPWISPNCRFEIDNCELEWTFAEKDFDYIRISSLGGSIKDWPKLYKEILRTLKPGGWFEQREFALPVRANVSELPEDCIYHDWASIYYETGEVTGRTWRVAEHWKEWLRRAGCTKIHTHHVRLPIGGWPKNKIQKEIGLLNRLSIETGLEGFATYICKMVLGWHDAEIQLLLERMRVAVNDPKLHAYFPLKSVWTQKPYA
ncbi:S-adenosyl-L-methionine-dependent methyltransferase [Pseudoneurospora amorphoporcata]|uniref:S-adenosyl-L-methionine-dependent methyltransferase n=1 Tax=Pseudoneurospora amorphoporcata TaxID=241081 RepID=A0AAN6NWN9_9PEZI|nr:S-adenosyl-L-methionine-dependent methyltransferase [Pseudoneurospora amorphoporcata]